jgi:hypothetical protein
MLTVKLYENDGTYIKDLSAVVPVTINASKDREIRRTATFAVPISELNDVKLLGRRIKIFDEDDNQKFSGYIDDATPNISSSAWVNVSCRDKSKVYKLARFPEDITYEDASFTDTTRSYTAIATSELLIGDQVETQGKFYGRKLEATVLGITSEVSPDSESGDPATQDYSIDYDADGLTNLKLTFFLDMQVQEDLQSITITTNGTIESTTVSLDGITFVSFSSGDTVRYIKVIINKASGPITVESDIQVDDNFLISNILTNDNNAWRPSSTDLDRTITLTFSSASINSLFLNCGLTYSDRELSYLIDIEYMSGTWTSLVSDKILVSGLNEIPFSTVTTTQIRIKFKKRNSPLAIRYAELVFSDSDVTINQIIESILTTENESDFSRIEDTRISPADHAITFLAGDEKLRSIIELANSINYEFFYDEDDKPVFRPIRWSDPADDDIIELDAYIQFNPFFTDANVFNVIISTYEAGDVAYFSTITNDSGGSSTSTVNIGTRTSPLLRNAFANTQEKLDNWTEEQLSNFTSRNLRCNFIISALTRVRQEETTNAFLSPVQILVDINSVSYPLQLLEIEPGQIIRITEALSEINGLFRVVSVDLIESNNTIDLRMEVENL